MLMSVGADVRDSEWLDALPSDRPAMIVADGLMGFLSRDEFVSLLNRIISHFPSGEMVFNSYTPFTIWVAHHAPWHQDRRRPRQVPRLQGSARARKLESPNWNLIEEILLSRDLAQVPSKLRPYYRLQAHSRSWSRKGTIVLHFRF
jgi:O-methyltransferase involved in polyketide biosynthesis